MSALHNGRSVSGWLRSAGWQLAHYFRSDGTSACNVWTDTTLDKPAPADAPRCLSCEEAVKRGLV